MAIVRRSAEEIRAAASRAAPTRRVMSDAEIEAAAASDPDNPPLEGPMLDRLEATAIARRARRRLGLSQPQFAERFGIGLARLRDLEQGRYTPDSALIAYLRVIDAEPDAVERALAREPV
ncbi:helix-turn-helix domain-containing protein [Salinarimonas ramus]|uniref:HTH cro/C1-type domain-containing protein n=1 Tax=Salinarimonas ramus TaxID=690164 RepID=A0A917QGK1_9HYPH|nr:helix-turn-helix domain-containing protein [Salinarimonas ramus]GGK49608.1 hypothetical protein GCM10011322_40780 [Salinarimonas ramus]